ncbi:MAG: hypothetical protein ACE5NC_12690 [Anaerolineae bacterium]
MGTPRRAQGLLRLIAQAIKAFLEAFDPLGRALGRLIRSGYTVRIYVTARDTRGSGRSLVYLIEIDRGSREAPQGWSAEDETFLRRLRIRVNPEDRRGSSSGEIGR